MVPANTLLIKAACCNHRPQYSKNVAAWHVHDANGDCSLVVLGVISPARPPYTRRCGAVRDEWEPSRGHHVDGVVYQVWLENAQRRGDKQRKQAPSQPNGARLAPPRWRASRGLHGGPGAAIHVTPAQAGVQAGTPACRPHPSGELPSRKRATWVPASARNDSLTHVWHLRAGGGQGSTWCPAPRSAATAASNASARTRR